MVKCPNCKKEMKPKKSWSYWVFNVNAYSCDCGTKLREYMKNGQRAFTLIRAKTGRWKKFSG